MTGQLIVIAIILIILLATGGSSAFFQGVELIAQPFIHIFPLFAPAFAQALEDYVTSAYFIAGVVIMALSSFGIILSIRQKKVLYCIISFIVDVLSIISIVSNFTVCS